MSCRSGCSIKNFAQEPAMLVGEAELAVWV